MKYDWITKIKEINNDNKSVTIIGSGYIASEYCLALKSMGISNVSIVGHTKKNVDVLCKKYGFNPIISDYKYALRSLNTQDLIIVCLPIHLLMPATELSLELGHQKILVEKPGSLYSQELDRLSNKFKNCKIRIGYQRTCYPNFLKLKEIVEKEGGIQSCFFDFTEWVHTINFANNMSDAYQKWGISNSLHIISLAMNLIGMPKYISPFRSGKLDWHNSGSIFVGSGISENNIPFSYHANWESGGRWLVQVTTSEYIYRLMPIEELYRCSKRSVTWEKVDFSKAFPEVKQGIAEELAIMLYDNVPMGLDLVTLDEASNYNKLAEKIFGYA